MKKKIAIKHNPLHQGHATLPLDVELPVTNETLAEKFMSDLMQTGFVSKNEIYLSNYINSDVGIALSHIKKAFKTYVLEGSWSEQKFKDVLYLIIKNKEMLVPKAFFRQGMRYENGQAKHELKVRDLEEERANASTSSPTTKLTPEEEAIMRKIKERTGGK